MRHYPLSSKSLQLNWVPLENKYVELTMKDDKYVIRSEQLHLIAESDNGVTFHKL